MMSPSIVEDYMDTGCKTSRQKRKRVGDVGNGQLVFIPVDSYSEPFVEEESLVASSFCTYKSVFAPQSKDSNDKTTLSLVEWSQVKPNSHPIVVKKQCKVGLFQENCSSPTEDIQLQSSVEEVQDSQTSQETQDVLNSSTESSVERTTNSRTTQVLLETAIAQLEKSVCRMEGVANMGFLELTSTTLDTLITYLWKIACPCFCFHLQGNQLSSLPDSIKLFSENITHLYLQNNRLKVFPSTLCCLKKLKVLDLSRNRLESLPEEISNLKNLVILDISNNNLKQLPASVWQMPVLKTIHYAGNPQMDLNDFGQCNNTQQ